MWISLWLGVVQVGQVLDGAGGGGGVIKNGAAGVGGVGVGRKCGAYGVRRVQRGILALSGWVLRMRMSKSGLQIGAGFGLVGIGLGSKGWRVSVGRLQTSAFRQV